MSLGLRVTFSATARGAQDGVANAATRVFNAQQAITTGRRINRASDDPGGAAQVIKLNDTLGDIGQYLRSGQDATSILNMTDSALGNAGNLVRQAYNVTLEAASSTNSSPESRQTLAAQIAGIKAQVIGIADTVLNGRYLFSGQKTQTAPFDPADPTNTYKGDAGPLRIEVNRGEFVPVNVSGGQVFSSLLNDLDTVKADILAGNSANLSSSGVAKMTAGLNGILGARGGVGARVNQVENTRGRLESAEQEFKALVSNTQDVDISQAIVELQASQLAYQASLASTAKTFQRSLMDYLQ